MNIENIEHFHAILDTAVDGIIIIDEGGLIHTFNRAASQMFGYAPAEVIGRNVSILMPEPFRGEHDRYMTSYKQTGIAKIIGIGREVTALRKDGSTFPIRLAVSEVAPALEARTFMGIVRDISEEKRLQKEVLDISEREQCRIGLDLHDGLCQELAGIALRVQSIEQKLQRNQSVPPPEASEITSLLQETLRHTRELSRSLYPVGPQTNALANALKHLAESTHDLRKVTCTYASPKPVTMNDAIAATHLYRIAQEAVRDAVVHGHAKRVTIELLDTNEAVELRISDDGLGLTDDRRFGEDMVLRMMQHRARAIGAELHITNQTPRGVVVMCRLPHRRPAAQ